MKKQAGIGLSEVLISLFLASLISILLSQLYLSCKKQYLAIEAGLEARLEVLWARDLLVNSIRHAGFTPCVGIEHLYARDEQGRLDSIVALKIEAFPYPLLQINRMSEAFSVVQHIHNQTEIRVTSGGFFKEGQLVLIADCYHAEVHRILKITPINKGFMLLLEKPLRYTYEAPVTLGAWLEEKWFIKPNIEHQNALHYQLVQAEELTPWIDSIEFKRNSLGGHQWIDGILGLAPEGDVSFSAVVRAS